MGVQVPQLSMPRGKLLHLSGQASILRMWPVALEATMAEETARLWATASVIEVSADW